MNTQEILSRNLLFHRLEPEALASVARKVKIRQFFPDEVIVWQGQPSTSLFLIANGIVAVKSVVHETENLLAYLMPGQSFGEVGILESQPRSATVQALSEVDVLVIQRLDFLNIMEQYPSVAVELARLLGRYLVEANRRLLQEERRVRVVVSFYLDETAGEAGLGGLMAQRMAADGNPTAYIELGRRDQLREALGAGPTTTSVRHSSGFEFVFPQLDPCLPDSTQTLLTLDRLKNHYTNIVLNLGPEREGCAEVLAERAHQLLLVADSCKGAHTARGVVERLRDPICAGEATVFTILTSPCHHCQELGVDFVLSRPPVTPLCGRDEFLATDEVQQLVNTCVSRLERTNRIGVYIPSTIDVDQVIDTEAYRESTLAFMASRFGGATCHRAEGVWNSRVAGLVGEQVHIVESYVTRADLNLYLDEVVSYVKSLKEELQQEAMALEVDRKLTLL